MSYDFKGKVVVVAGGGGALGRAVVARFTEDGATVVSPERSQKDTEGGYTLDAVDEESVRKLLTRVKAEQGRLDVLVNAIGSYTAGQPVSALDLSVFESQLDLNLKAAFLLTKHAVQVMTESEEGGKIVHISSRAALDQGKNSFAYSVSKQGVLRLVEAVAAETRHLNININAVLPSIIDSLANRKAMPDANHKQWPRPEEIARVIAFLSSDESVLINGAAIPVYGKA